MARLDAFRRWPWFAIAFALFPLLHIASTNPGQVSGRSLVTTLAVAVLSSAGLLVALRFLLGDWLRAGIGVSWFVVLFFGYGPLDAALARPGAGSSPIAPALDWLGVRVQVLHSTIWLALLAFGWLWLFRRAQLSPRLSGALNLVSLLLIGITLTRFLAFAEPVATRSIDPAARGVIAQESPDIYFILLDGYARADVLAEYYGHDNGPFLRGLEQRGFQVADASNANYSWTFLSLSSTLNMDYLPELLGDKLDVTSKDRKQAYQLIRDNRAAAFLRARGYRFVHLQSTWGGTGKNPFADEFRSCGGGLFQDDYLLAIQEVSWLRILGSKASLNIASCHLRNLETLTGLANEPGPKFVVAHFVPPHHPYLFDRDGRVLREANLSNQFEFQKALWEDRDAYRDQLVFISRSIERVIDGLIADSKRPPVILLLSDHGPSLASGLGPEQHNRVRLATLSAVLLPGAPANTIPEDVSNVNLLRIVFNQVFGAGLPQLPVQTYMSSYSQPFYFMEVDRDGIPVKPAPFFADNE